MISAIIAAVSGFFLVGYTGTSFLDVGTSYNTKTIAAVIIGEPPLPAERADISEP